LAFRRALLTAHAAARLLLKETDLTAHVSRVRRIEPALLERTMPFGALGFHSLRALEEELHLIVAEFLVDE
jgi:hypothetical protein